MNDDESSAGRRFFDRVSVTVSVLKRHDDPEPLEQWFIVADGAAWDVDWLTRQVQEIPLSSLTRDPAPSPDHYIDIHERRHEWGASGALIDIVLGVASGVATNAAWDAMKALARLMGQRLRDERNSSRVVQPLDEGEAVSRARWLIEQKYGESAELLHLDSVEIIGGTRSVICMHSSSGWAYELDLELNEGLVTLARIKRSSHLNLHN